MPSKRTASKRPKKAAKRKTRKTVPKDLRDKLEALSKRIDQVRLRLSEDPESMAFSMQLAGLNELRWNILGEVAQRRGDVAEAAKAAIQEGRWSHQKVQCAKQRKTDLLREMQRSSVTKKTVRERFRTDSAAHASKASSV